MPASTDRWSARWSVGESGATSAVQPQWIEAQTSALAHVFHRLDLQQMWMDTIGAAIGATRALVEVERGDGAIGRLATVIVTHRGSMVTRRVLEPMGQDLFGYHDPLFTQPPSSLDGFWSTVRNTAPPHDQALFRFVDERFAPAHHRVSSDERSPVLSLDGCAALDDVLARTSANHRGDVRRRLRRLRERGEVTLYVYGRDEAALAARHFDERCWPHWVAGCESKGFTLPSRPGFRAYCDRLLRVGVASGLTHYSALRVGGADIGWHLGLRDRDRLYWWLPAHDATWDEWSPGKVALALLIEHAIGAGCRELHFQTGAQPYKMAWRPDVPPRVAIGWHAGTWRGRALGVYDAMRSPTPA